MTKVRFSLAMTSTGALYCPQHGVIRCQVVACRVDPRGREVIVIDTELPDHVEATTGETCFEVSPDKVNIK